jgi:hypothetical protein
LDIELIERIAVALFEAEEDLVDEMIATIRQNSPHEVSIRPRTKWSDPENDPCRDAFRYRARKAIEALGQVSAL